MEIIRNYKDLLNGYPIGTVVSNLSRDPGLYFLFYLIKKG
jgi:hypothetical protein